MTIFKFNFRFLILFSCRFLIALLLLSVSSIQSHAFFDGLLKKIENVVKAPTEVISDVSKGDFSGAFNRASSAVADVQQFVRAANGDPTAIVGLLKTDPKFTALVPPQLQESVAQAIQGNNALAIKALMNSARSLEAANKLNEKQLAVLKSMANSQAKTIDKLIKSNNQQREQFFLYMNAQLEIINRQQQRYESLTNDSMEALLKSEEISGEVLKHISTEFSNLTRQVLANYDIRFAEQERINTQILEKMDAVIAKYKGDKEAAEAELAAYVFALKVELSRHYTCHNRLSRSIRKESHCAAFPNSKRCQSKAIGLTIIQCEN